MSCAIIRNAKCKAANMQGILRHNERQNKKYGNKDIDTSRSDLNYHFKEPKENSYEKEFYRLREENNLKGNLRLTEKKQSNVMCEFLITSDNEFLNLTLPMPKGRGFTPIFIKIFYSSSLSLSTSAMLFHQD